LSLKVSEKGGLSVYGLGRFPVTLYKEQWEKLLGMADEIRKFIRENDQLLKKKEPQSLSNWLAGRRQHFQVTLFCTKKAGRTSTEE
jgi:dsDNA-binding SOS-regulon protein